MTGGCVRAPEPASTRRARRRAESLDLSKQYPFWITSNETLLFTVPANVLRHVALGPLFQEQRPGEAVGWMEGRGGAAHCPRPASLRSAPHGLPCTCSPDQKGSGCGAPSCPPGRSGSRWDSGLPERNENHRQDPKRERRGKQLVMKTGPGVTFLAPQLHHGCHRDAPPELLTPSPHFPSSSLFLSLCLSFFFVFVPSLSC